MRPFILISFFISNLLSASTFNAACAEWNNLRRTMWFRYESYEQSLQAQFMKSKGYESSQLLVVGRRNQEDPYACRAQATPIYPGLRVCTIYDVEKASDYALRIKGEDYYAKVSPWGTSYEERYEKYLDYPRALKEPVSQGTVVGSITQGPALDFKQVMGNYRYMRDFSSSKYGCTGYSDHTCIRKVHEKLTNTFRAVLENFPRESQERFEKKVTLLNQIRELNWQERNS